MDVCSRGPVQITNKSTHVTQVLAASTTHLPSHVVSSAAVAVTTVPAPGLMEEFSLAESAPTDTSFHGPTAGLPPSSGPQGAAGGCSGSGSSSNESGVSGSANSYMSTSAHSSGSAASSPSAHMPQLPAQADVGTANGQLRDQLGPAPAAAKCPIVGHLIGQPLEVGQVVGPVIKPPLAAPVARQLAANLQEVSDRAVEVRADAETGMSMSVSFDENGHGAALKKESEEDVKREEDGKSGLVMLVDDGGRPGAPIEFGCLGPNVASAQQQQYMFMADVRFSVAGASADSGSEPRVASSRSALSGLPIPASPGVPNQQERVPLMQVSVPMQQMQVPVSVPMSLQIPVVQALDPLTQWATALGFGLGGQMQCTPADILQQVAILAGMSGLVGISPGAMLNSPMAGEVMSQGLTQEQSLNQMLGSATGIGANVLAELTEAMRLMSMAQFQLPVGLNLSLPQMLPSILAANLHGLLPASLLPGVITGSLPGVFPSLPLPLLGGGVGPAPVVSAAPVLSPPPILSPGLQGKYSVL